MQRKKIKAITYFVISLATFQFSSCTLIGLGIGAGIDASKPDQAIIRNQQIFSIKPGTMCLITLTNGDLLTGKFSGIERISEAIYAENYAKSRRQNEDIIYLPTPHDSIIIKMTDGKNEEGFLIGFDFNTMIIKLKEGAGTAVINLEDILSMIDQNGNVTRGVRIRSLNSEGIIPHMSAIVIQNEKYLNRITMNKIMKIKIHHWKKGKLTGTILGALADIAFIFIIRSSFEPDIDIWSGGSN